MRGKVKWPVSQKKADSLTGGQIFRFSLKTKIRALTPLRVIGILGAPKYPNASGVSMSLIVTVANEKGGVGKTTTAVELALQALENGHKACIVDTDHQQS